MLSGVDLKDHENDNNGPGIFLLLHCVLLAQLVPHTVEMANFGDSMTLMTVTRRVRS